MTETPLRVSHVCFYEDVFERFAGSLAFGLEPFTQKTVDACVVITLRHRPALWAFRHCLDPIRDGIRTLDCLVHQAIAADSVAHKWRISSSTSAGFSTV